MKIGTLLLLLLVYGNGFIVRVDAGPAHQILLADHGVGDSYPHKPFTAPQVPWTFRWKVDCSRMRQKYALFHVIRWDRMNVIVDLVRVEATGHHPTRYAGFKDPVGRANHWLHAFGDGGIRREQLPAGRYIITVQTACRWNLWVTSP